MRVRADAAAAIISKMPATDQYTLAYRCTQCRQLTHQGARTWHETPALPHDPVLRLMADIWGEPTTPEIYEFAIKPA